MKFIATVILLNLTTLFIEAQIICVKSFEQRDSISVGVNNLLLNGGFENGTCSAGVANDVFCPVSTLYSCDITNWVCSGGGNATYSYLYDSTQSLIVEGNKEVYFGNGFCTPCSPTFGDTSCLNDTLYMVFGIPNGYPVNGASYGGATGVSLEQTVNGLTIGSTYILEFWAGGEAGGLTYPNRGLFAVDIGFGNILLRCTPTQPIFGIGTRYIIEFKAISTSHTVKFTNWGHICSTCTELVLDDVRLYTLGELSPAVTPCTVCNLSPVSIIANKTVFCSGDSAQVCAPSGYASYYWNMGQTDSCIKATFAGNYYVTVTDANGCTAGSNHLALQVYPLPPVSISVNGDTLSVHNAVTQQWFLNGNAITGATDTVYIVHTVGSYTVSVTDTNGCIATSLPVIVSGVDNLAEDEVIIVFPNPSHTAWQLTVGDNFVGSTAELTDVSGKLVFQQLITNLPAGQAGHQSLITADVASGVYFLRITSGKSSVVRKLVRL